MSAPLQHLRIEKALVVVYPEDGAVQRVATDTEIELQRRIDFLADFIEKRVKGASVLRGSGVIVT